MFLFYLFLEIIEVNLDDPDDHFQFKVYPCLEMEGVDGKKRYEGFFVTVESDIRFYLMDPKTEWYSCRIFSSNQLLVSTPASDYDLMYSREFVEEEYDTNGDAKPIRQIDDDALESIDAYNNRLNEDDDLQLKRKMKYYILNFPRGVQLSVKEIFAGATEDDYLDGNPLTVRTFHEQRDGVMNARTFVTWKVIDKARGSRKIGPGDLKPTSKMASKLGIGAVASQPNTAIATYKNLLQQQMHAQVQQQVQQQQAQAQQQVRSQAQAIANQMFQDWQAQQQQQQGPQPDNTGSMQDA